MTKEKEYCDNCSHLISMHDRAGCSHCFYLEHSTVCTRTPEYFHPTTSTALNTNATAQRLHVEGTK